jgi:hypothetical protein
MFALQLFFSRQGGGVDRPRIIAAAEAGESRAADILRFMENLPRFPFFSRLHGAMTRNGLDLDDLLRRGQYGPILDAILSSPGLDFASLPKGLVDFHRDPRGERTAFEEHLVEAAATVRDRNGLCRLHFTVSSEHRGRFEEALRRVKPRYEERCGVQFQVDFSEQRPSTDAIAVDLNDRPFRLDDGQLLLRPGGHGALLENLDALHGDIVFIKNIDNVVPDRLKGPTVLWKRILSGLLVKVQGQIFSHLEALSAGAGGQRKAKEAMDFAVAELSIPPPPGLWPAGPDGQRTYLLRALRRPLRVCGVVRNQGEPGGGPFWVEDPEGLSSLQIVESVQVDLDSPQQRRIWETATHFNPVDLVCGVRDGQGIPYDLRRFTDPSAVLITRKSKDGLAVKALEHPGLWNGAMARWNTIFVEVPLITFNPVKTIDDLLREEHRA